MEWQVPITLTGQALDEAVHREVLGLDGPPLPYSSQNGLMQVIYLFMRGHRARGYGYRWELDWTRPPGVTARLWSMAPQPDFTGRGDTLCAEEHDSTLEVAVCRAALRERRAETEHHAKHGTMG